MDLRPSVFGVDTPPDIDLPVNKVDVVVQAGARYPLRAGPETGRKIVNRLPGRRDIVVSNF